MKTAADIIKAIRRSHPEMNVDDRVGVLIGMAGKSCYRPQSGSALAQVRCMLTTSAVDQDEEVVLPDGGDIGKKPPVSYFEKVGSIFIDHTYSFMTKVASLRSLSRKGNGWECVTDLLPEDTNEYTKTTHVMARECGLAMSIGFKHVNGGPPTAIEAKSHPGAKYIVREWKAMEGSYTPLPCNDECLSYGVRVDVGKMGEVRDILTKANVSSTIMDRMGIFAQKRRRVVVCE